MGDRDRRREHLNDDRRSMGQCSHSLECAQRTGCPQRREARRSDRHPLSADQYRGLLGVRVRD